MRFRQTREFQTATCVALSNLSTDIATSIANLIVAFYFSWKLTMVILATVPVSILLLKFLSRNLKPAIQSQKQELAFASKNAISAIAAIDLVKVFNGVDQEIWQYSAAIKRSMHVYLTQARANACQMGYVKFWMESMFVIGFYYGVVLVNQGMGAGNLMTTFYAVLGALQAIESFVPMYLVLAKGMSAGQALHTIADEIGKDRKIHMVLGGVRPDRCVGEVKVSDVSICVV
jgi:ATP-binding cassette subfamily B (MDR/TAP) protein 1